MKKSILFLLPVFFLYNTINAQVGIGTTTPQASAMLDVTSTSKGLLIPRVALTGSSDITTIPTPAISLLIYNNATVADVTPGYYYWNGAAWLRLSTGSSAENAWQLTGNAGTVDGTNFIGTTDDVPFNIRVNNQKAGRIDSALQNTFWGYRAGNSITIGRFNTAAGYKALYSNTAGGSNTANGRGAMFSNLTGGFNTAHGESTLQNNTTGNNNTANGYQSLLLNQTGYSNVAVGAYALRNNTTSSNLVAVGDSALYINTGIKNTAVGSKALYANTTSEGNTATGFEALYSNTTGFQNTATGTNALYSNISGYNNTVSGINVLYRNTGGSNNTASGSHTLYSNTTGSLNAAYGAGALYSNNSGDNNTANGFEALTKNTTGFSNIAIGMRALFTNTTSSNLVAVGDSALYNNTGTFNTAVGSKSLYNTTGAGNTANGFEALLGITTGNNNTAIGYKADVSSGFGAISNATAIGYNSQVAQSNSLVLGGTGADAVNVGIGKTAPASRLHIVGSNPFNSYVRIDGPLGTVQSIFGLNEGSLVGFAGTLTNHNFELRSNNAARVTIDNTGKVGIGTISPQQNLSVNDGMNIDQSNSNTGTITSSLTFGNLSGEGIGSKRTTGGNFNGLDFYTNFINRMVITTAGRVGIGIPIPTVPLDVAGNIKTTGDITVQTNKAIIRSNTSTPQKLITTGGPGSATIGPGVLLTGSLVYEAFSTPPTIYVGNISGTGDMAKVLVTCSNVGVSSCTLNFYNPSASTIVFNGTFNFVAVGAQ